jgi:UDP-N-acetylglucosamine 3-dehydrogenase
MIRIGLIGCGTHANWAVVPAIKGASDLMELVAICDINKANVDRTDADNSSLKRYLDYKKMLSEVKLDAVYIATLPDTHAAIAIDALNAGLHTLLEKPMAHTTAECEAIMAAAAKAGKQVAVNFELRYHTEFMKLREWVRSGRLGRVRAVHIQNLWDGHKIYGEIGARRKRLIDLAGTLDCGIHKADLARYFLNGATWTSVTARGRWFGEDNKLPSHTSVMAEMSNGTLVTLNASFAYTAYTPQVKAYSDVWTLVGDKGVINFFEDRIQPAILRLHSETLTEEMTVGLQGHAGVMVETCRDFARMCVTGVPGDRIATGLDGVHAQIFVERANRDSVKHRMD